MLRTLIAQSALLLSLMPITSFASLTTDSTDSETRSPLGPYLYTTYQTTRFPTLVLKEMEFEHDAISAQDIEDFSQESDIELPAGASIEVTRAFYDEAGQSLLELKINNNVLVIVEEPAIQNVEFALIEHTTARRGKGKSAKGTITSRVGMRKDPFTHAKKYHAGTDIAMPIGTPVLSRTNGVVIKGSSRGYGGVVYVQGGGYISIYAHLSKVGVRPGQKVGVGTLLGKSGCSGRCTGPHLHFEQRRG